MRLVVKHITTIFICFLPMLCWSQDLEGLKDRKLLDYSGGISATNTFYNAWGIDNRRDPFFWQVNANLNFTILGIIQAPFSATFSQQDKNFSQPQPFNRFGMSPTYKGVTLHLGHRSMNFSSYTLAGNLFFGVGAEYRPETSPLRVSALYGRFAKPVARSAQQGVTFAEPTFRRMGYGVKLGFEKDQQQAHLVFFTASDDPTSIPNPDSVDLTPEENVVLGLVTNFRIFRKITLSTDYAYSLYSRNANSPEVLVDDYSFVNNLGGLFTPTSSSNYATAATTSLAYNGDGFQVNGKYRRVDPEFTTLGSSFLNNDLEDISGGVTFPLFQKKVSLSTSAGVQRNNLDNQLNSDQRRFIFSSSVSWMAGERFQVMANYGNFNSSTTQVQIQANVLEDTLEFFQVSRNGSMNINYTLGPDSNPIRVSWMGSVQDATDSEDNTSTFVSNTLNFQKKIMDWNVSVSASANKNHTDQLENLTAGPVANISRSFMKGKYRASFSTSLLNVYANQELVSSVMNYRLTGNFRAGERHGFTISAFYVIKNNKAEGQQTDVRELRGSVNYNFRL